MPFWDPDDGYGTPFAATMQPQPFYPFTALLTLNPSPRAYTVWVLVRLFLAGWFAALFLRLFADRYAAASAGIATSLSGYYLLYYDMPHLSVDVGLPMLLWATELVIRRVSPARVALLGAAAGLTYLGGMPESAVLSLAVAFLYGVLRIVSGATGSGWLRSALGIGTSHLLGIALGAIMLIPFGELISRSFNLHEPRHLHGALSGLGFDGAWRHGLLTEITPLVFGSPWLSILTGGSGHSGVRGFFGVAALVLAIIALFSAVRRRTELTPVIIFFAGVALYSVLKRYGNPAVEWTGALPLFKLVNFPKYIEFCLGTAMAILAGFGVAALRERRAGPAIVVAAFAAALGFVSYLVLTTRDDVPAGPLAYQYPRAIIIALGALLVVFALAYAGSLRRDGRIRTVTFASIAAALVLEPFVAYGAHTFWRAAPTVRDNPYAGAPYVTYLEQHVDRTRDRVFGVSGLLFPNWAGAYGFADPASLNALYPEMYLPFVDAFVAKTPSAQEDQFDRFTGIREIPFASPKVRRWLALSSISYLISPGVISFEQPPGGVLSALWEQAGPKVPADKRLSVRLATAELDGVAEDVLFEHPPYHDVVYSTRVPRTQPFLVADLALDPASYADGKFCGGEVTFTLDAERGGRILAQASQTIDPKHRLADRHWIPLHLDLSKNAGRDIDIRFATSANDTCAAWAIWGEPRFAARGGAVALHATHSLYPVVFRSPRAYVYRVAGSLPRISIFHRARVAASNNDALRLLVDPRVDPLREAIIAGMLPPLQTTTAPEHLTVRYQRSDEVKLEVDMRAAGLLVQNDTFFPGWVATVDDHDVPILLTDANFRGIPVPAGRHVVTIAYRSRATALGTAVSLCAVLVMLFLLAPAVVLRPFRRRAAITAPSV